ncbi:MAG: GNAT family N-acetyltransferase [Saprospiraceae bacterium]|nr:GNAT family N-acetyltransferase [Saprospiraceae bacterium]
MIKIRRALIEDLIQIADLFNLYRIYYRKTSDVHSASEFLKQRIEKDESVIFVAEDNELNLVGFVQLYPIFSSTRMKRLWLVNDLYVKEENRSQGISKVLMEAAQEYARETHSAGLILETAKDNYIGNQLYPRVGFTLDEEHNYYSWEP